MHAHMRTGQASHPLSPCQHAGPPGATTGWLPANTQCGGNQGSCSSLGMCMDAAWPGYACASGYTCARQGADYWQCRPPAGVTLQLPIATPGEL
jgi:hypothetical protein